MQLRTDSVPWTSLKSLLLAGLAAAALSACANNRAVSSVRGPDFTRQSPAEAQSTVAGLAARYKADPRNKTTIIHYGAALRAAGQPEQAVAVIEQGMKEHKTDKDIRIEYAKALTAAGRFDQAVSVVDSTLNPAVPDWNALSVKGAALDQVGRNEEARALYRQALLAAPGEAAIEANLGLSFAMTSELPQAEQHLRRAVGMRGATGKIRQNLALVVGLQGRFDEARQLFAAELAPEQVDSNMTYIRALLTQQNRWDLIKGAG